MVTLIYMASGRPAWATGNLSPTKTNLQHLTHSEGFHASGKAQNQHLSDGHISLSQHGWKNSGEMVVLPPLSSCASAEEV